MSCPFLNQLQQQQSQSSSSTSLICPHPTASKSTDIVPSASIPAIIRSNRATVTAAQIAAAEKTILSVIPKPGYDDGSLAPLFIRLGWHSSGTFDGRAMTGGSDGARIRFAPESTDDANAGLSIAVAALESVKKAHPEMSYADLYTLAAVVAVKSMSGPIIQWRSGRCDLTASEVSKAPIPNGRLPDGALGAAHIRSVFNRMGFSDREIVALSGAHTVGRCHLDRSGFDGPWTFTPTRFTNQYFKLLLNEKWQLRQWSGKSQYENISGDRTLMMLPTDIALIEDPIFRPIVEQYAEDKDLFFKDFAIAFSHLLHLGLDNQSFKPQTKL